MNSVALLWWESPCRIKIFSSFFQTEFQGKTWSGLILYWPVFTVVQNEKPLLCFLCSRVTNFIFLAVTWHQKITISINTPATKGRVKILHLFLDEGENSAKGWGKGGHHLFSQVSSDRMRGKDREVLLYPTGTSGIGKGATVFSWLTLFPLICLMSFWTCVNI